MARPTSLLLLLPLASLLMGATPPRTAEAVPKPLSFDQRVSAERAVQQVYWATRYWPEANAGPKPDLATALPDTAVRRRVTDLLRMSNALATRWGRVPSAAELSAELQRMASESKAPETLRALLAALGDDPLLEAEVLARRAIVEREVRAAYDRDRRLHAATRAAAESTLASIATPEDLARVGQAYRRRSYHLAGPLTEDASGESLAPDEFASLARRLQTAFGRVGDAMTDTAPAALTSLPVGRVSALIEDDDAFRVVAILDASHAGVTVATASWAKLPFDAWWAAASSSFAPEVPPLDGAVVPPVVPASFGSCATALPWTPTQAWGVPSPRERHTAVWTGAEMIVWGGIIDAQSLGTGHRYDPATNTWTPVATAGAPKDRSAHTAVWTGTRMIVWGGTNAVNLGDGGIYDPVADTWSAVSTTGAPSPRSDHTAVWTGTRMIVWGGAGGGGTGASYDPVANSWSPISASGAPSDRSRQVAAWTGSRMLVWGGRSSGGAALGDGGSYDPVSNVWTPLASSGAPSPRWGHTGSWSGSALWVFGGTNGSVPLGDGARYAPAGDAWTALATSGAPAPRTDHAAVWTGSRLVVWGGSNGSTPLGDGARYDAPTERWLPLASSGAPAARSLHTAVWTGSGMLVFGGQDARAARDDGGRYDPSADAWSEMAAAPWAPSSRRSMVSVSTGAELLVYGGETLDALFPAFTATGAVYDLATDTWKPMTPPDPNVVMPRETAAIWTGAAMVVWGGRQPAGAENAVNTGGRYDPVLDVWTPTSVTGAPAARSLHTSIWTGSGMIVWGGTGATVYDSGGRYDPVSDAWAPIASGGTARYGHVAVWTGAKMLAWGGQGLTGGLGGPVAIYDPGTNAWSASSTPLPGQDQPPSPRINHTAVWTGTRMIVWGGQNPSSSSVKYNDGSGYDPGLDRWFATASAGAPGVRDKHVALWTGARMVIWGGTNACCLLSDGGEYDPAANAWTPTFGPGAPQARGQHTAASFGDASIVWGGLVLGSRTTNTGAVYCACSFYRDADGDAFGDPATLLRDCSLSSPPAGYVRDDTDCNDADPTINPAASDANCDGIDQNCNGVPDDGFVSGPTTCGLGACAATGTTSCVAGVVVSSCMPGSPSPEICDGIDNDCDGVIDNTPNGSPGLSAARGSAGSTNLTWTALFSASSYDVTRGTLGSLRAAGFTPSVDACVANDTSQTSASDPTPPSAGDGFWYLVRGSDCAGPGTYDDGSSSQSGSRDGPVDAAPAACP